MVTKIEHVKGLPIVEIENFISTTKTTTLLQNRTEKFKSAISHYPNYYRNNDRLVEDNNLLSKELYALLNDFNINGIKKFEGLNTRLRFCRYQKDQLFSVHQDGVHYPDEKRESKYTFLLYLNGEESFSGGNTEFFNSKYETKPCKTIIPQKGKLVIFDHKIWHKGAKITQGNKYILRSDIYITSKKEFSHHNGYIWSLLKYDDTLFFSCGRDAAIKLWNHELNLINVIQIHTKSVLKIARLNSSEFISCSRDFTLKKWNYSGTLLASITLNEMLITLTTNAVKKQIIAVGTSGHIFVFNYELVELKAIKAHTNWIWDVLVVEDDYVITCSEDRTLVLTHLSTGVTKILYKNNEELFSLCKSNNRIFIGTKSGAMIDFSLKNNTSKTIHLHKDIIRSINYYSNEIISCGEDGKIMAYGVGTKLKREITETDNFIQDSIVLNDQLYVAGFDGRITINNL